MSDSLAILLTVVFLLGNAFFVAAEFSLVAARRTAIEDRAATGSSGARMTVRAMDRVSLMMAGAQLGITACSLGLGALGEPAVAHLLEPVFHAVHVPESLLHVVSFVVAMTVVVFLHMVLGEMVPKNISIAGPERAALLLGPPMYLISFVLRPLLWLMNALANGGLRLIRITPTDEVQSTFSIEDVPDYLEESHEEGLLEDHEHQLMRGALKVQQGTVDEAMIGPDRLVAIDVDVTVGEAEQLCARHGHSRFPVRDGDDWVGYVHLKDLLDQPRAADEPLPRDKIRNLVRVPVDASLLEALRPMQRTGSHLAMVVGDDDRVAGWVMLEDVMELMIGTVKPQR